MRAVINIYQKELNKFTVPRRDLNHLIVVDVQKMRQREFADYSIVIGDPAHA